MRDRLIFGFLVVGLCAAVALVALLCSAASGQPAPVPVPWTKGTKIVEGGTYTLPASGVGASIVIDKKDVTIVGGWAWPDGGPLFNVKADNFTAVNVRLHHPSPPTKDGKRNVPACMFTQAKRATLLNCEIGTVGEIVKIWPGGEGTLVAGNVAGPDVFSAAVGGWGAKDTAVVFNTFPNSVTENLIRFSPQGIFFPSGAVVAFNDLANPGNKSVLNPRFIDGFVAFRNTLAASTDHAAIGSGDIDGDPEARGVYLIENKIREGSIMVHAGTRSAYVLGNVFDWDRNGVNVAITANGGKFTIENLTVDGNTGDSPAAGRKPLFNPQFPERIKSLRQSGNDWAAPTTRPVQ